MLQRYKNFLKGISVNRSGRAGIILTTSSFITFIFLEIPIMMGIVNNVYVGIITYLILPAIFLLGLILIPIGWHLYKKKAGKSGKELLSMRFSGDDIQPGNMGSRLFVTIGLLTILNVIFLALSGMGAIQFMDEPSFCGTACHTVMGPEWVTYRQSPHARVKCVECHVGEGVGAKITSKMNGVRQIISLATNSFQRPIPTPVHQLRPARETCEKCHWPEKFYGSRLKRIVHFNRDENSTPSYSTLNLKVDTGSGVGESGIHWHISQTNEVRYVSVNDMREIMLWVEYTRPDRSVVRYTNERLPMGYESGAPRIMDCVDCHNRATHIYEDPARALDDRMSKGFLERSLPFLKREGLAAITANYPSRDKALKGIEKHLLGFYRKHYPGIFTKKTEALNQAIAELQGIFTRNVHHRMNIKWHTYPNHIGHHRDGGCFRCHNSYMKDQQGNHIRHDCTLCHSILALKSPHPFHFVKPAKGDDKEGVMHKYLQKEFFKTRH